MTFNLSNLNEVKKYSKVLNKRASWVLNEYIKTVYNSLYQLAPKRSGALASSFNISVNSPDNTFDPNKTSPSIYSFNYNIKDNIYISTGCPYASYVNYRNF